MNTARATSFGAWADEYDDWRPATDFRSRTWTWAVGSLAQVLEPVGVSP